MVVHEKNYFLAIYWEGITYPPLPLPFTIQFPSLTGKDFLGISFNLCVILSDITSLQREVELLTRTMQSKTSCSYQCNLAIYIYTKTE